MFNIHHSSDTGWIFPRKKKTKQQHLTSHVHHRPPETNFFRGFSRRQHGAKTILKAIDEEDQSAKFFRETSHRPEQGWKCAQQFYRSCFSSACVFLFLFFIFFFALSGPFFDSARPVTKYLNGCVK